MSRIDDAVERILRVKFIAGLFEYPLTDLSLLDLVGCKVFSSSILVIHRIQTLHSMKKDYDMIKLTFDFILIRFGLYLVQSGNIYFFPFDK